ncbi:MAG TPA: transporter substrate-binding domain-containing protein, partial [Rheinheimera sp.]|nr:transporter substrate-binding domain-containing protein [Rheinheimera sp.]
MLLSAGLSNAEPNLGSLPNPLKVVIGDDTFPYAFTDESGQAAGLVTDYWREIGRRQNVAVEFVVADWADTLSLLQRGEVHVHGAIAYNEDRARNFQLVGTGIEIYSNVFLQRDLPSLTSLTQLSPFVIGAVEKSSQVEILRKLVPNATIKTYATPTGVYDAALKGEISVMAGLDRLPEKYPRYKELISQFPLYKKIPLRNIDLNYAVNLNSSFFPSLVKATEQVEQGFLDQLERKWLALNEGKDTLLLGLGINNPPYMHISLDGEAKGLYVDLWHLWSEQTGVKIAFVPDTSFNSLRNLQKGRIDAFIAFPDSELLPSNVEPAYQLYGFHSQFFTLAEQGAKKLTSSSALKVGLLENAAYESELKRRYPQATFFRYRFIKDLLAATIDGELDGFYAATETVKTRLYQAEETVALSTEDDTMVISPMFSLIQKGKPELAQLIRSGFSKLPLEQLVALEEKWLGNASFKFFENFKSKPPLTAQETS